MSKRCIPVRVSVGGDSSKELPLALMGVHSLKREAAG
jgi:hypothetical protein